MIKNIRKLENLDNFDNEIKELENEISELLIKVNIILKEYDSIDENNIPQEFIEKFEKLSLKNKEKLNELISTTFKLKHKIYNIISYDDISYDDMSQKFIGKFKKLSLEKHEKILSLIKIKHENKNLDYWEKLRDKFDLKLFDEYQTRTKSEIEQIRENWKIIRRIALNKLNQEFHNQDKIGQIYNIDISDKELYLNVDNKNQFLFFKYSRILDFNDGYIPEDFILMKIKKL
jgi:hypothetical protein